MMNCKLACTLLRTSQDFGGRLSALGACVSSLESTNKGVTLRRHNHTNVDHALSTNFKLSHRSIPHPKENVPPQPRVKMPQDFRHIYPEFLPLPIVAFRNKLSEKLERQDMLARRAVIDIPEFYVGSIMAVTVNDPHATGKINRFVGICIERGGAGLRAWFILRNVIDNQGLEIQYDMYCPLIASIETLRLEKRLDDSLVYLRDALPEYSTFSQEMEQEMIAEGAPVPLNEVKVRLQPMPWHSRWARKEQLGIDFEDHIDDDEQYVASLRKTPHYEKFDLMKEYRLTIPEEEQEAIFNDVAPQYPRLKRSQRLFRRKRED